MAVENRYAGAFRAVWGKPAKTAEERLRWQPFT
jgi:hypothetical protein